ncbi:MAG: hypothetical protein KatS3mg103_0934 [Phycisphaerales bacterium]|nr:MAG: hypothetical protein KatS3mg103_0934 [Phycisphaerales bacterium]
MGLHDRTYMREDGPDSTGPISRRGGLPVSMSAMIILANVAIELLKLIAPGLWVWLFDWGHFSTLRALFGLEVWRFVTFQFLHANLLHLAFNMIGIWFLGRLVEDQLGPKKYLAFYLVCGIFGGLMYLLLNLAGTILGVRVPGVLLNDPATPLIGASAGVFGVVMACAYIAPNAVIQLLLPPIPMRMKTFAYGYVALTAVMLLMGSANAGGEAAHLGGAIAGFYFIRNSHLLMDFFDVFKDSRKPDRRQRSPPSRPACRRPTRARSRPGQGPGQRHREPLLARAADPARSHRTAAVGLMASTPLRFTIHAQSRRTAARVGSVQTLHGCFDTPGLHGRGHPEPPCAALTNEQLRRVGVQVVLNNAYHLWLRPGPERLAPPGRGPRLHGLGRADPDRLGRLPGLLHGRHQRHRRGRGHLPLDRRWPDHADDSRGVHRHPEQDRCRHHHGPGRLPPGGGPGRGSVVPDPAEAPRRPAARPPAPRLRPCPAAQAGQRTHRAVVAARCVQAHARPHEQALFGIVQGGTDEQARWWSAQHVTAIDLPGYAIGGVSVGREQPGHRPRRPLHPRRCCRPTARDTSWGCGLPARHRCGGLRRGGHVRLRAAGPQRPQRQRLRAPGADPPAQRPLRRGTPAPWKKAATARRAPRRWVGRPAGPTSGTCSWPRRCSARSWSPCTTCASTSG